MLSRRAFFVGAASVGALSVVGCNPAAPAVHTASKTRAVRALKAVVGGVAHVDGAGVKLWKQLGHRGLAMLDPFLMLDRFRSDVEDDFVRGFPEHPHRGFETVSIVLDGHVLHKDSVGNSGDITGGGLQWMTAGRGIVHSEMLAAGTSGVLSGYQLWINLPSTSKMTKPRYQDTAPSSVPTTTVADAEVRVLAGAVSNGTVRVRGPIDSVVTQPLLLDVRLPPRGKFVVDVDADDNAFVVVADGSIDGVDGDSVGVYGAGDVVEFAAGDRGARALLFAARPIGEPVARRGPFVMNTAAELDQAFADYRSGRLVGG